MDFIEKNDVLVDEDVNTVTETDIPTEEAKTSLEFEIAEEGGLVFMSETDVSFDERGGLVFAGEADITPEPETDFEPDPTPAEEFSVPDSYELEDKYTSTSFVEDPFGMKTTYVPRFTDVSENYRMKGDPRPAPVPERTEKKTDDPLAEEESLPIDPTAEIGEGTPVERVVVTTAPATSNEPTDESIKVYKFEPVADTAPSTVAEPAVEPVVEEVEEPVEEPTPAPAPKVLKRPEEYDIPDPETRSTVITYEDATEDLSPTVNAKSVRHEFVAPIQRDTFKDKFLDSLMSVRLRLIAAILLVAVMVVAEIMRLFGNEPLAYIGLSGRSYAGAVVDLMFAVALFALALPEIVRAFATLLKKVFAPELFAVISLLALFGYTAVIVADQSVNYLRFGILYALQILSVIIGGLFRLKGDFAAFRIVARNMRKNVLIKKLTRELPRENIALDGAVDEYSSKTARMFRTVFVNDFFAHASRTVENSANNLLILGCSLGLSAVTGVVSFFLFENSISYAVQSAMLLLLVACPTFSLLIHKLPYCHAARVAGKEGTAFVGEGALYDAADLDVIAYEDTEIFGVEDVTIKKVHLYGKVFNTAKAMHQMYAIFSSVGGPLDNVFSATVDHKGTTATDVVIEEDGILGTVDGHRVAAGSEEYMRRHGMRIPSDDYRTSRTVTDSTRVLYGAEDGEVYVKFFIRYSFTEEFTMILPYLKEQGIVPLVYTRDPNINNELLKTITMGEDVIRVMKKDGARTTEEKTYRQLSSNVVTLGDRGNIINIAFIARKYAAFQSSQSVVELISMIVGAALAALVAIGGMIDAAAMALVGGLALWQVAWCVVLFVRSRLAFRISKNK